MGVAMGVAVYDRCGVLDVKGFVFQDKVFHANKPCKLPMQVHD